MDTVKIILNTSIVGKNEDGIVFSWANGSEQDCESKFAERLVQRGQASYVLSATPAAKVKAKPTQRKKSAKKAE